MRAIEHPRTAEAVQGAVRRAIEAGSSLCICGGRHAMGGQQFASGQVLLDMSGMDRVLAFDAERGLLEIEAGADWGRIIRATHDAGPAMTTSGCCA